MMGIDLGYKDLKLLKAKRAIFKLIGQFHHATKREDGELYIFDYCESALEAAFDALEIENGYIKLMDFCQMWEDNNRAIAEINNPDKIFGGITADIYYEVLKEGYKRWQKEMDEIVNEE